MTLSIHLSPFFNFITKNHPFHHVLQSPFLHSPKNKLFNSPIFKKHHFCTLTPISSIMAKNQSLPPTARKHSNKAKRKAPYVPSRDGQLGKKVNEEAVKNQSSTPIVPTQSNKARRKAQHVSPDGVLRKKVDMCSKNGDVAKALGFYDEARTQKVQISRHVYNVLLYLCSSDDKNVNLGLSRGFEIFEQMSKDNIAPDEATFTNAARLAVKIEDPEMAFELVKKMKSAKILPKLRSYDPALFGFCKNKEADKAYEVDDHMVASGVCPEELQLAALLQVSVNVGREDKVYEILHRLRSSVRQVSETTAEIIEQWFKCRKATEVGKEKWDVEKVQEGVVKGGGGWHGQGWLGTGDWKVMRTEMDKVGVCQCCGERLACTDINPLETENFAHELSRLASQREVQANFTYFQNWLRCKGSFEAVIDGANVGLNNAHAFSFFQLNATVECVRQLSPTNRFPLIILHTSRVDQGPAHSPKNKKLLEKWQRAGALYATPRGSNDDWYWLYAAVSSKCLLVTNDEMRDHLFQLLGTSFFPRWKERHQVRYTSSKEGTALHMPPPYSIVIQESEGGNWHIPLSNGDGIDTPRQWVCATRSPTNLNNTNP